MRREGWIYALTFLAIVAVGGLIIGPRLGGRTESAGPPAPLDLDPLPAPAPAPGVEGLEPAASHPWVEVTVGGVGGGLRGNLRSVEGAEVEIQTPLGARHQRLRVRATGPAVWFGATGHQWLRRTAAELRDGLHVELPVAAPPLLVRVREVDGRPVADVPARVVPAPPGEPLRTDAGGTLVLDHLPPGLVVVDLSTDERTGPTLRLEAAVDRDVRAVLEPAWTVAGRVVTPAGTPVAGARLWGVGPRGVLGRVVVTGRDGTFAWAGPAVPRMALVVRAARWAETALEVTPPATGTLRTETGDVELGERGVALEGIVEGPFLEADAHVLVEPAVAAIAREIYGDGMVLDAPRRAPLGADGRFRFHDLPPDLPLRVSVRGAGVPVDLIVSGKSGEEVPVHLEPPRGDVIAGHVRHPDGTPAVGVALLVSEVARDGDRMQPGDTAVHTGADGAFRLRGLGGRTYFLRAYAPGHRSLLHRIELPLRAPLDLAFEPAVTDEARRVVGRVHDGVRADLRTAEDDPLRGEATEIEYGPPLPGVTVRAAGLRTVTDENGAFRLEGVESLAPLVGLQYGFEPGGGDGPRVDPRPFAATEQVEVAPGGKPLSLVLQRTAALRFRVLDAIDDAPVAFLHVLVRSRNGRVLVDRGVATRDGEVVLDGLTTRGVDLFLVTHGRRHVERAVALEPGRTRDLGDLLMSHGMRVEGTVRRKGGGPLAGARVAAYGGGWQSVGRDPAALRELLFRVVETDDQGRFAIEGFERKQPVDLAIWASGHAPTAVRVSLPSEEEGVTATIDVELDGGGYLGIDLHEMGDRMGPGAPIHGALVDLEYARDGSDFLDLVHRGMLGGLLASSVDWRIASTHLLAEQRGGAAYVFGPLRPGPYEVWIERPGFARLRRRLTVMDPDETLVELLGGGEARGRRLTRIQFEMDPD